MYTIKSTNFKCTVLYELVASVHHGYILWYYQPVSRQLDIDPLTIILGHIRSLYKGILGVWVCLHGQEKGPKLFVYYYYICGTQKSAIWPSPSLTVLLGTCPFNVQIKIVQIKAGNSSGLHKNVAYIFKRASPFDFSLPTKLMVLCLTSRGSFLLSVPQQPKLYPFSLISPKPCC